MDLKHSDTLESVGDAYIPNSKSTDLIKPSKLDNQQPSGERLGGAHTAAEEKVCHCTRQTFFSSSAAHNSKASRGSGARRRQTSYLP